jgi:hypothetical protein
MTFGGQRQLAGSMFALARKLPGACSDLKFHRRGNCSSRNHRMFPVVALSMSAVIAASPSQRCRYIVASPQFTVTLLRAMCLVVAYVLASRTRFAVSVGPAAPWNRSSEDVVTAFAVDWAAGGPEVMRG